MKTQRAQIGIQGKGKNISKENRRSWIRSWGNKIISFRIKEKEHRHNRKNHCSRLNLNVNKQDIGFNQQAYFLKWG